MRSGANPLGGVHAPRAVALARRPTPRNIRLASGLVLFVYVTLHLVNHALGLLSVDTAERGLTLAVKVWHSLPGTLLLYGAAAAHVSLAFVALYRRRTLRMPPLDLLRIVMGLGIPLLLIGHAVATRIAYELYQYPSGYHRVVWALWVSNSEGRQLALLAPGWLHGCLGIHFAFNRRRIYQRLHFVLFAVALLLPVLAGLGFLSMAKELATNALFVAAIGAAPAAAPAEGMALAQLREGALGFYLSAIALVFAAREIRTVIERRRRLVVAIAYPNRVVHVPLGWSVLEASRSHHIPHLSMCGGRARCSTCRVRVIGGNANLPAPEADEAQTLARIGAPPNVRLACQLRPRGDIVVVPLLAAGPLPLSPGFSRPSLERHIAIMLVGWQDRAAFALRHLAQDVLYLARLFGEAVMSTRPEGVSVHYEIDGDQVVALFGLDSAFAPACRSALATAARVERALVALEDRLERQFGGAARFCIVVHAGRAAVGDIGFQDVHRLMAAGTAIDTAIGLRKQADRSGARCIVSNALIAGAGATMNSDEVRRLEPDAKGAPTVAYAMASIARAFTLGAG